MPNCLSLPNECSTSLESNNNYRDVIIIGNGPSGLCLSYFLAGNWPYWNKNRVPDEYLQMRLDYCGNEKSIVEQDLDYLSDNLDGRSNNPVALLYDQLKQPNSDLGIETPSCLTWKYDPLNEINHLVIGKSAGPGGAWNDLDGSQLTISPSKWMELPNMSFSHWESQNKVSRAKSVNAGLVFSALNSNFSEDKSLLNGNYVPKPSKSDSSYNLKKYLNDLNPQETTRASMHDVKNYYRDYVKQKNMDKYLLNNATVASVRRICCSKVACQNKIGKNWACSEIGSSCNGKNEASTESLWEVTGLIDKRDRKKTSSLSHGEINEFRYTCKHLVLACGANDLHNTLNIKGENYRYILRTLRELEEKIQQDHIRLKKAPLLIVGAGLSAADAILLAQKHNIKIIHVIRRSVNDPNLVFKTLPKKSYPEYHEVYEKMLRNRYNSEKKKFRSRIDVLKQLSQNDLNNNMTENVKPNEGSVRQVDSEDSYEKTPDYTLYDEHQVKYFTSKHTCKLIPMGSDRPEYHNSHLNTSTNTRHLQFQKQCHENHMQQLKEHDEESEGVYECRMQSCPGTGKCEKYETEIKISFACILIGYKPDLDFLQPNVIEKLGVNPQEPLDTKNNPILVDTSSHEVVQVKNLYAMGPLIGDNFVRFGTGGALAICNKILNTQREDQQIESPICKKSFKT